MTNNHIVKLPISHQERRHKLEIREIPTHLVLGNTLLRNVSIPRGISGHSPINKIADDRALLGRVGWLPSYDDIIPVYIVALQVHGRARGPRDQGVSVWGGRGEGSHMIRVLGAGGTAEAS